MTLGSEFPDREMGRELGRCVTVVSKYIKKKNYGQKQRTHGNTKLTTRKRNLIIQEAMNIRLYATEIRYQLQLAVSSLHIGFILKLPGKVPWRKRNENPLVCCQKSCGLGRAVEVRCLFRLKSSILMAQTVGHIIGTELTQKMIISRQCYDLGRLFGEGYCSVILYSPSN